MSLDWSIIQAAGPVDIAGNFARGYQLADTIVSKIHEKNALGYLANNPDDRNALAQLYQANPQMGAHFEARAAQRQAAMREQQGRDRQSEIGGLVAAGDTTEARTAALQGGDFDLAAKIDTLDDPQKKQTAAFWSKAGPIAYKLRQTPDPTARKALWNEARPILEAQGAPAHMLDQFDPTNDTQLDAAITTSRTISELIEQGKITWHQQGEQPSFATDSMGRPVGSQNPYAGVGKPTATSGSPQEVASVLSSGGLPPHVVAGFLGNFHAEGGYGGAKGDGGSASGIAQWRGERATNFERVVGKAPDQASPAEQAQFVLWEMQNPEAAGMSAAERDSILKAPTAEAAAALIDQHYERSAGHHLVKRMAAAKDFAASMGATHHVASKAEYDKLPSGTPFVAPDGSRRVKP